MNSVSSKKINNKLQPYFTIFNIDQQKVGFTDILMRWSTLYKLGVSLGYTYIHQPIICKNTNNIYNFLGFNDSFSMKLVNFLNLDNPQIEKAYNSRNFDYSSVVKSPYSPRTFANKVRNSIIDNIFFSDYLIIDIVINEAFLQKYNISQLKDLQTSIKSIVSQQVQNSKKKVLIRFQLGGARQKFYRLINSQIADFPDRLNLREVYLKTKNKQHRTSHFLANKLKLLVHIRQGDTAFIETPWKTFIPVYGDKSFTELNDPKEGGYADLIDVAEYYNFVNTFVEYIGKDKLSMVVSSDGYKKAFSLLDKNIDKFDFDSQQIEQLHQLEKVYLDKFDVFNEFENISCFIGETDKNLHSLIDSALEADIIIMGFRNTLGMLLKIMANYYDFANPPVIIELYKHRKPFDSKSLLGINHHKAHIISVKLDNFSWEELMIKITKLIKSRK